MRFFHPRNGLYRRASLCGLATWAKDIYQIPQHSPGYSRFSSSVCAKEMPILRSEAVCFLLHATWMSLGEICSDQTAGWSPHKSW